MKEKKISILYIDDEDINLRLFKSTFRREFDIHTIGSAVEALKFLKKNKVDIVITDQQMPEMTGVELLKEIYNRYPEIPPARLMVSGYSATEAINEAYSKYNLHKLITKPWEINDVRQIIYESIGEENHGEGKI